MKRLNNYIIKEGIKKTSKIRDDIKFIIWQRPEKKIKWLENNDKYQKIEYKYEDVDKMIFIQFLLGYVKEDKTWKMWIGKIGAASYDDDPYCKLDTEKFSEAILTACDKIEEFIEKVNKDPLNYIQFYKRNPADSGGGEEESGEDSGGDEGGGRDLL